MNATTDRARPPAHRILLSALLVLMLLLLTADCDDDTGPGSYNPSSGNTTWWPKGDRR